MILDIIIFQALTSIDKWFLKTLQKFLVFFTFKVTNFSFLRCVSDNLAFILLYCAITLYILYNILYIHRIFCSTLRKSENVLIWCFINKVNTSMSQSAPPDLEVVAFELPVKLFRFIIFPFSSRIFLITNSLTNSLCYWLKYT